MIEALSFLGPLGPVVRVANSCIYYDSEHAAGVCLGTFRACTHVQLALACQQSMLKVQHRSRLTMQHVYGHTRNLGNECGDHAAAHGTFACVSNHNPSTRWVRHNFDTSACLEQLRNIYNRNNIVPSGRKLVLSHTHCITCCLLCAQPFTVPCCISSKPWKAKLLVFLPLRVLVKVSHTTCGNLQWSCYYTSRSAALSNPLLMKLTWRGSHSLVMLLLMYSVFTNLHDATLGTIARGVYLMWYVTIATPKH